ncbi:MAG: hypothetical protein ABIJ18_02495 [archaeon]
MEKDSCCKPSKKKEGFLSGILYGLLPHTGCIAFVIFAVLGVTAATTLFKPLLMNAYFFYILIAISLLFATISAMLYLRKHKSLSITGVKGKWRYLIILYGSTIVINLILFFLVFPATANMMTGNAVATANDDLTIQVDIPCSGHASLISSELYTLKGVSEVKYRTGNYFYIIYDSSITSKQDILNLDVFNTYPATVI